MRIAFVGNFHVDYTSETHHKKSLEALGHEVVPLQEGKANADEIVDTALGSDLLVWVHTHGWRAPDGVRYKSKDILNICKAKGIPTLTYHLDLWLGLKREKDLEEDPFYKEIDYFFATDKLMADWFNDNTLVKGRFIPAGVFDQECAMLTPQDVNYDVIFVGSKGYHPEYPYRPQLVQWLRQTYGSRFLHVGGDGDTGTVRGLPLNQIYANAKIAVGDSLNLNFNYPYYTSDRLFESTGRGGFTIYPNIKGLDQYFDPEDEVAFYEHGNLDDLKEKIDFYLANPEKREAMRLKAHNRCKNEHTYINRWEEILKEASSK